MKSLHINGETNYGYFLPNANKNQGNKIQIKQNAIILKQHFNNSD
jgi:hypothetical protein